MPPTRTIGGGQNNPAPQTRNNSTNQSWLEKNKNEDWFRIPAAGILATLIYSIFYFVLLFMISGDPEPWLRHLVVLLLSIGFFAFVGFAQIKAGKLGDAIITFLVLIYGFQMAVAYL